MKPRPGQYKYTCVTPQHVRGPNDDKVLSRRRLQTTFLSINGTHGCSEALHIFAFFIFFFSQRFIDWICWMYVLARSLWKSSVLGSFTEQSMKLTGNGCIYALHLSGRNVWKGQLYLYCRMTLQLGHLVLSSALGCSMCSRTYSRCTFSNLALGFCLHNLGD